MNIDAIVILLTQVVILVTALFGFLHAFSKVKELHISLNSRLDQLLKAVAATSHAEGLAEGLSEGRAESRRAATTTQ